MWVLNFPFNINNMKALKIILTIIILNVLLMTSCKKSFLETKPLDQITASVVFTDAALAQTYINGIYLDMHKNLQKRMKDVFCDDGHRRDAADAFNFNCCLITSDYIPSWPDWQETWTDLYSNVRRCNVFLENIKQAQFDASEMIGEVKFLRAWLYHQLARMYGGVPIISKPYQLTDNFNTPRGTYEDVIKFIVADCDTAASLLPIVQTGDNIGRATKGAALALKSRTLLYAASDLHNTTVFPGYAHPELIGYTEGNQVNRWQAAKDAAKAVIDMNVYSLYMANPGPGDDIK